MGRKTKLAISETARRELFSMIETAHTESDLGLYKRCKAILLLGEEKLSQPDVARFCDSPTRTIRSWVKSFKELGAIGLVAKPRPGAKPKLTTSQLETLQGIVRANPEQYGLETGIWTAPLVRTVIKKEFGVIYDVSQVRRILHKLGFSIQYPRESLSKADLNRQFQWLHFTFPAIKKSQKRRRGGILRG